ncbi:hypothetical protein CROQUDRAFT_653681 [Cronartium quercuum f. sp. fusiforme G11]|uniref:HlyIII-domain-containing protein n=1 Tax=Cronartium quercuum f. sp. fusiforme G11 TaxID=708437 RepID=A0A9P6NNY4_9BASI|nr:hypothetical protein CROQUDRAFT_653681 [Cronartium quercuum f. sp. fusiforme G11]
MTLHPSIQRPRSQSFHPSRLPSSTHPVSSLQTNHHSIESLDLPLSLPISLLSLRHFLLAHVHLVEERLQSITSHLATQSDSEPSSSDEADDSISLDQIPPSPLRSFVEQVSTYVDQLKLDLFSSACPTSVAIPPYSPLALGLVDNPLEIKLKQRLEGVVDSVSIPDAAALLQTLTLHAEKVQAVVCQLSAFAPHPVLPDLSFAFLRPYALPPEHTSLDSLRAYFRSESDRLSSLLPAVLTQSSNTFTSTLRAYTEEARAALEGGESFIREEGEKLKEWVDAETESLKLALQAGASRLLTYHELPPEWKNNRFILSGYRFIPLDRWRELLYSALQWHNETINIHTHFIGTLSLLYLLAFLWPSTPHTDPASSTIGDRLISLLFLICAIKCLVCSTAWHLFAGCGTLGPFRRLACVDYVGISGLIAASVISAEYYGFYCRPSLAAFYIAFTAATGIVGMILPFQPFFDRPESKSIRIAFFVSMACSALIPQAHMASLYGVRETVAFYRPGIPSVISYLAGLFFYASNCPERIRPGWIFDTLGHSHQFWHIAIVIAIWLHWRAIGAFHDIGRSSFSCENLQINDSFKNFGI